MNTKIYSRAHKLSSNNKTLLSNSNYCGCFYCLKIFDFYEVKEWIKDSKDYSAICPYCSIDSVIPDNLNYNLTEEFLEKMNEVWF